MRADAARNRDRILESADRLFARHGVDAVTVAQVAEDAGVGKATVFRRFGDKAGLVHALLDADERELQDALLTGPPPLGPGAPPRERLLAFVDALARYVDARRDLLAALDHSRPGARFEPGSYGAWHQHARILLAELRPDAPADLLADLLLAPLAADLVGYLRRDRGVALRDLRGALADLTERLSAP